MEIPETDCEVAEEYVLPYTPAEEKIYEESPPLEGGEWMVVGTEEVVQSEEKQAPAVLSEQRPLHFDGRIIWLRTDTEIVEYVECDQEVEIETTEVATEIKEDRSSLESNTVVKYGNSDLDYEDDSQQDDRVNQSPNKEKVIEDWYLHL